MFKKTIMLSLILAQTQLSFAESKTNCSGINQNIYPDEYRTCLRLQLTEKANEAGVDCVDCFAAEQENKQPANWVLALSAVAQPLAYLGSAYITSKYQYKSQQAWADAYANGAEQCTNRFNTYLNYTSEMGANPVTSSEAQTLMNTCNGSSTGYYSGFGGMTGNAFGGFGNPWQSQGYTSGFMGGMTGPYFGGYAGNMYGAGMGSGIYSGMSTGLYGNGGMGIYGSIGIGSGPYGLNYNSMNPSMYPGMYGANMNNGGMGINSMKMGAGFNFGTSANTGLYSAGNLSNSTAISSSSGFAF